VQHITNISVITLLSMQT